MKQKSTENDEIQCVWFEKISTIVTMLNGTKNQQKSAKIIQ